MSHDMHNIEMEMDKILDSDSDFIESLCKHLEEEGIHLTNDLLAKILSAYEDQKFGLLKGFLEQLVGQEGITLNETGGPAVVQVVLDGKLDSKLKKEEEDENDPFMKVDSKYLV